MKLRARLGVLIVVALVVAVGAVIAAQATAPQKLPPVAARVEAQAYYGADEPMKVKVHLHNPLPDSVWVPKWQVPSDEMEGNLLDVTRDGVTVEYTGILVKRAEPTDKDYVEIPAGATLSADLDPSGSYDMADRGAYSVRYRLEDMDVRTAPPARRGAMPPKARGKAGESTAATLWFDGVEKPWQLAGKPGTDPTGGFSGRCTTTQQNTLKTAHADAISISTQAENYLKANPDGESSYLTWFGLFSTANHSTVVTHYGAIINAFTNGSPTYDCSCKKNYYAYVYPTKPYTIYVCRAFWAAPAQGRDSKAGTLVHEMSHFYNTASTQDYVYGAAGAQNLASTDPAKAIMNADNHEYYAEDRYLYPKR